MGDDALKLICWINDVIKHDHDNCLVEASILIMINAIIISIPHMLRSLYFFDEKTLVWIAPHSRVHLIQKFSGLNTKPSLTN